MTTKYTALYNKSIVVSSPYVVALLEDVLNLDTKLDDYLQLRRDPYDPYGFIEWLVNTQSTKYILPDHKQFNKKLNKADKFYFHTKQYVK